MTKKVRTMDRLWAPWRTEYVRAGVKKRSCFFCDAVSSRSVEDRRYVVSETKRTITMLNIYPYNNGHLMIAPLRHVGDINDCTPVELAALMSSLTAARKLLGKVLSPDGFNIGMNIGRVAGAGLPGHLHLHIVPRWNGDTNFMPVCGETKVVSQSLEELHKLLIHAQSGPD